jgi:hypothetical protein
MKTTAALLVCALALCPPLPAADAPAQKTTLDCDHAEMWTVGNETHGVCTGAVTLLGTNLKIACDRLEFVATAIGDTTSTLPALEKFKFMLAVGHVVIVQGDREASCGRAEVLPRENKVVLTESPVVIDHGTDWTSAGDKITLLRGERRVIVEKSRVVGPPIKDLGFDKSKTATPPDGPAAKPTQP